MACAPASDHEPVPRSEAGFAAVLVTLSPIPRRSPRRLYNPAHQILRHPLLPRLLKGAPRSRHVTLRRVWCRAAAASAAVGRSRLPLKTHRVLSKTTMLETATRLSRFSDHFLFCVAWSWHWIPRIVHIANPACIAVLHDVDHVKRGQRQSVCGVTTHLLSRFSQRCHAATPDHLPAPVFPPKFVLPAPAVGAAATVAAGNSCHDQPLFVDGGRRAGGASPGPFHRGGSAGRPR